MMARVCDALPLISFYWPMVSVQDYGHTAPLHQCRAGLTNTLKHVRGGMTVPPQLAPYVVEMATAVARIIAATERVVGDFKQHHTGILFVVPVSKVFGLEKTEEWD